MNAMAKYIMPLAALCAIAACGSPPKYAVEYSLRAELEEYTGKTGKEMTGVDKKKMMSDIVSALERRLEKMGARDVAVDITGVDTVRVRAKTLQAPEKVRHYAFMGGILQFRFVDEGMTTRADAVMKRVGVVETDLPDPAYVDRFAATIAKSISLPADLEIIFFWEYDEKTRTRGRVKPMAVIRRVELGGNDIKSAWRGRDEYDKPAVHVKMSEEGSRKLAEATSKKNHGRRLAVVLDGEVCVAPAVHTQVTEGHFIINGSFTKEDIEYLESILTGGKLPVRLTVIGEKSSPLRQ